MSPEQALRPYFLRDNYIKGYPGKGTLRTDADHRVVVLPEELIVGLHRSIQYETGHAWPIVAYTCGQKWGARLLEHWQTEWTQHYCLAFEEAQWVYFEVWLRQAFSYYGWGKLSVDFALSEEGIVEFRLQNSLLARLLKEELEQEQVCEIFAGFFAALASRLAGRELQCLETACEAGGHDHCHFVVALERFIEPARQQRLDGASPQAILAALRAQ